MKALTIGAPVIGARVSTRNSAATVVKRTVAALKSFYKFIFSSNATIAAMVVVAVMMWLHIVTAGDGVALGRRVALDTLCLTPWAIVWLARYIQKGGAL